MFRNQFIANGKGKKSETGKRVLRLILCLAWISMVLVGRLTDVQAEDFQKVDSLQEEIEDEEAILEEDIEDPEAQKEEEDKKKKKDQSDTKEDKENRTKKKSRKLNGKKVYLTFDDGPSSNTDKILEILDRYDVKATFFVIGRTDKASKARYKKIVEKGHTIALHSYTHNYKQIYASLDAFKKDYKRISDLIYRVTGVRSKYYRFPGGSSNTVSPLEMSVFVKYLNKEGIRYYDWNVLNQDADGKFHSPNQLYYNVINPIRRSKEKAFIVLMHDSEPKKNTVKALPKVLETLLKDGYQLLPIDDQTVQIHHAIHKKR